MTDVTQSNDIQCHGWLRVPDGFVGRLRPYQTELIERVAAELERGERRVLVQAPTGAGKTHIIAAIVAAAVQDNRSVLILGTRSRIVRQIHERLEEFRVPHGVIAAALRGLSFRLAPVQVASADTLYRRSVVDHRVPLPPADVVIFDEAHLACGDSRVAILNEYRNAVHLGFTATPAKVSGRPLSDRFDVMVLGPSTRELINLDALVRSRVFSSPVISARELAGVRKDSKSGDYAAGELGAVMVRPKLVGDVLTNWLRLANGKRTLVFAVNKAHGAALESEFTRAGIATELLTDANSDLEREAAIGRLERGVTVVLVNCFLLSYGIDIPSIEAVVLARPTRSVALYLQAVGRGMRPSHGKTEVFVIDHGRVVENLGLPTSDFPWALDEEANVNLAAQAGASLRRISTERPRTCPECTHMWLVSEDGPTCAHCGWRPTPRARGVCATDEELLEVVVVTKDNSIDVESFYRQALDYYRHRYPNRWAAHEKPARWAAWCWTREALHLTAAKPPARFWKLTPQSVTPDVAGKCLSQVIRYARSRSRAEAA